MKKKKKGVENSVWNMVSENMSVFVVCVCVCRRSVDHNACQNMPAQFLEPLLLMLSIIQSNLCIYICPFINQKTNFKVLTKLIYLFIYIFVFVLYPLLTIAHSQTATNKSVPSCLFVCPFLFGPCSFPTSRFSNFSKWFLFL